jgi:hypothetical protein
MGAESFREPLQSGHAVGPDGERVPLDFAITADFAEAIYRLVRARRPARALEIGMAYGISSLAIMSGLVDGGSNGTLTSIDPNQSTDYRGLGRYQLERNGYGDRHRLIERVDYLALPDLVAAGERFDFIYIDGWHSFDFVMLDAFYADRLLDVHGVMGFNDCGWFAVNKALRFISTHWSWYDEIDVGLTHRWGTGALHKRLARRVLRAPTQDRYFEKRADGEVHWAFYRRF